MFVTIIVAILCSSSLLEEKIFVQAGEWNERSKYLLLREERSIPDGTDKEVL